VSHQQRFRRSGLRIIRAFFCDASPSCKKTDFFSWLMKKHTKAHKEQTIRLIFKRFFCANLSRQLVVFSKRSLQFNLQMRSEPANRFIITIETGLNVYFPI